MSPIEVGSAGPAVDGVALDRGPVALWFYKVTCPVCQTAAPKVEVLHRAFPGRVVGVGQDPPDRLEAFGREHGTSIPATSDLPPYPASEAYGIRVVPTLIVVDRGSVADVVEAWDRDGYNRVARRLAELAGTQPVVVSDPSDGLPQVRPG